MVALPVLLLAGVFTASGETVLLSFGSPDCPHCQAMGGPLGKLETQGLPVREIDVRKQPDWARHFRITAIPTYVMLVDGQEVDRVVGSTAYERLAGMFPQAANPNMQLRGQSPEAQPSSNPRGSYLGDKIGQMFGRGPKKEAPSGVDPFAQPSNDIARPGVEADYEQADQAAGAMAAAQERAAAATVRLKVEDSQGHSIGSGTIVDIHGGEALVVTCGHIFRQSQGKGRVVVDLFHPTQRSVEGKLLGYDLDRDIAVIAIAPGMEVVAASVASTGMKTAKGSDVFSVGCDKGAAPSVRESRVTALDRYKGPPNIEAAGAPIDGRSGGGLFNAHGNLIGVCNAADPEDNEGIYAAIATIHWQLDQVGLSDLYRRLPEPTRLASHTETATADHQLASHTQNIRSLPTPPQQRFEAEPFSGKFGADDRGPTARNAGPSGSDTEVICIVRSRANPAAKNQIFLLDQVSPELMQRLASASRDRTAAADMTLQADRRSALPANSVGRESGGPVFRGQSFER